MKNRVILEQRNKKHTSEGIFEATFIGFKLLKEDESVLECTFKTVEGIIKRRYLHKKPITKISEFGYFILALVGGVSIEKTKFNDFVGKKIYLHIEQQCDDNLNVVSVITSYASFDGGVQYSGDKSDGYFRRLSILHFSETYSIDKKTADVNLSDTLSGELSGILNWALEGLERLRNNDFKFTDSKSSRMLLKKYKLDINPIMEFIHERIVYKGVDSKTRTENMRVYREFQQWARRTGHKLTAEMSTRRFWNEMDMAMVQLRGKKIVKKRSNTFRYCKGIELKKAEKKDDDLDELFESDNN